MSPHSFFIVIFLRQVYSKWSHKGLKVVSNKLSDSCYIASSFYFFNIATLRLLLDSSHLEASGKISRDGKSWRVSYHITQASKHNDAFVNRAFKNK